MVKAAEAPLCIACIQMEPSIGQTKANVDRSIELINAAADRGAGLVVLPELCNTGYVFRSRAEAYELAEQLPDGPSATAWIDVARQRRLYLVAGIAERLGPKLYNAAILAGPDGYIGKFRKIHLWSDENLFFEPGDLGFPVFDRLGAMHRCTAGYRGTRNLIFEVANIVLSGLHDHSPDDFAHVLPIVEETRHVGATSAAC